MTRSPLPLLVLGSLAAAVPAAPSPEPTYIDLQPKATQKLTDDVGGRTPKNNLASVPTGEQAFAGVKFKVGPGLIQLGSPLLRAKRPDKVEGIAVGRVVNKFHFLHSTLFGKSMPVIEDGTVIARYVVRYGNRATEAVEVKYGEDVRDWWAVKDAPRDKKDNVTVAWEGENEASRASNHRVRLYLTTWKNPHPARKVAAIDFARAEGTQASPFCVAITAE